MIEILDSLGRFRRAANLLAVQALKPLGLGTKQASILRYLAREGRCSHADLARHSITDPAATGRIVDALVKAGCVVQKEHPSDRRCWVLSLTPRGRALAVKVEALYGDVAATLVRPLTPAERRTLLETFDRLADALDGRQAGKKEPR